MKSRFANKSNIIIERLHDNRTIDEAVEIDTSKWAYSYGNKRPRGYGSWWFRIGDEEKSFSGEYKSVRKEVTAYAKSKGVSRVFLLP